MGAKVNRSQVKAPVADMPGQGASLASSSPGKNLEIEVLRGFAILFTLLVHLKVLLHGESGIQELLAPLDLSVGVDLFLVISGFVITGSVVESARGYRGAVRSLMLAFWIKRIFRLLPAAWSWIIIAVLAQMGLMAFTSLHYEPAAIARESAAALFNVMNWYTPHCFAQGGGLQCAVGKWLGHYWSLSLEEQFYLLFPLLFFCLPRKLFVSLLALAIAVQLLWQRPFFTYAWYFKTDALCWGIILALAARQDFFQRLSACIVRRPGIGRVLGISLLILLPVTAAGIQGVGQEMKPWGVGVVAMICAAIVWLASLQQDAFFFGKLCKQLMLYLGSRSYSLYLAHLIIYYSVRDSFQAVNLYAPDIASTLGLLAVALSLTFAGAELTYRLIEQGLRQRGREIAARILSGSGKVSGQNSGVY
jgi:peptidoglycan/LPS O-acetylase OafA/YrhL